LPELLFDNDYLTGLEEQVFQQATDRINAGCNALGGSHEKAMLAGGATIQEARVRHVFLGVLLFYALFIVSPQAGQNIFSNAALGEYFRSFVAYGTIAFALMMDIRQAKGK
jgi:hypothetical protein